VILRVTEGEEKGVCEFLQTIDLAIRNDIAESVKMLLRVSVDSNTGSA
jgi:hypothetical protein